MGMLLGHSLLDESTLSSIGLFLDGNEIIGLVTHDMRKPAYIVVNPQYGFLKPEMVEYAIAELSHDGISHLFVDRNDMELISIAKKKGYFETGNDEYTAVVYECINRCMEMGAKKAVIISNQDFYYRIGFKEYAVSNLWEKHI